MTGDDPFRALVQQVRAGDQQAAAELVRQYEPEIRRVIHLRLTDPRLRRVFDSMDVCQSVLGNFFIRVAAGQFELEKPEDLLRLLVSMARNKLFDRVRRQHAGRRDQRRQQPVAPEALADVAGTEATPSRIVAGKEMLRRLRAQLAADELYLADQRAAGRAWAELAAETGSSPEALRKKLTRALDRVGRQLGLEEEPHA